MKTLTVYDELANLERARVRGMIDPEDCLRLRVELKRFDLVPPHMFYIKERRKALLHFALAQTQALYAEECCEPPELQRKKYMRWLERRADRLKDMLRKLCKDELAP
jgi:hypothetical protein